MIPTVILSLSWQGVDAVGNFAENQKIAAIRKVRFVFIQTKILTPIYQVYQRAVINPMINIETLWKDYCSFEQSINPMIAEKLTQVGLGESWDLI